MSSCFGFIVAGDARAVRRFYFQPSPLLFYLSILLLQVMQKLDGDSILTPPSSSLSTLLLQVMLKLNDNTIFNPPPSCFLFPSSCCR
jgi:hypothetical protein